MPLRSLRTVNGSSPLLAILAFALPMHDLRKKAIIGVTRFQIILALLLFLPAWSLGFWQAWVYWIMFFLSTLLTTSYLLKRDPVLLESRLRSGASAEREKSQKIIQALASVFTCGVLIVPGIERRFHSSIIPLSVVLVADALVVAAFVIVFLVFRENSYASSIVEVKADQRVISTGPYRIVRHPMYAGAVLMFLATPLALGSLWAFACAILLCGVIVARLLDEERYLSKNLPGYRSYCRKVRYRLIPYVW
jgi:protein-S-isoprenylcysteine O-methyltransferase Ste14